MHPLYYADNIPRKKQFVLSTRIATKIGNRFGFLNSFRLELTFLYSRFPDANEFIAGPIGFAYWQWDWSKENRKLMKKRRNK